MDGTLFCDGKTTTITTQEYFITSYNKMNNNVSSVPECFECDEMKKLDDISWFPGLFAKLVSLATLSVLTTTANVLMMYVSCQTKSSLVANTRVFFASLCFAHLLGSLIVIPFWIVTRLSPELAQDSPVFCQSVSFFWILMSLTSFYSLSALSLDRFFIISNPMRYPVKATTHRKLAVVALLWLFCILFAGAPISGWGEYTFQPDAIPICGLNMKGSLSFTIFLIAVGFGFPLIVDIFCCGRIISIARRQSRSIDHRKSSDGSYSTMSSTTSASSNTIMQPLPKLSKLKQKLNSLRLVFAGTGSFLVCWLPYLGAHVWMTTIRNISHAEESMPYIMEFVVMCIALLNGLINPVVLMLSNREHRREIRALLFRRLGLNIGDERSDPDTDSVTINTRRNQFKKSSLSQTFQTIQEFQIDVGVNQTETHQLKKQESNCTIDSNSEQCPQNEVLDICRLQLSVVGNKQEVKRLISQSSNGSIDLDPHLEHVKVEYHVQASAANGNIENINEPNNSVDDPGIVIK